MITITIHKQNTISNFKTNAGNNLLHVLRNNGFDVYAPCGGNGTCGKCEVLIKGEGTVTSCFYTINKDIEVILPDTRQATVLVAQHAYTRVLPLLPGKCAELSGYPHGVAIDIGTTTLVLYLVNLITGTIIETRTALNPQAKYGADVISRIQFTTETKNGIQILQNELLEVINKQLNHFTDFAEIAKNDIIKITVAGNTTMMHLLLGVNPASLAQYPFTPVFIEEKVVLASDLGLHCNINAEVKLLPSISAFVGADIVAGLASIAPSEKHKTYLFMDIGTNGELALVLDNKIVCCSTAAGPAFEGAKISCGMGAVEGAISAYNGKEIIVIGDEKPLGICGSGLLDIVSYMVSNEIVKKDGLLETDFIVVVANASATGKPIVITQNDIRELQLAKSAISAGVNILLKHAGLSYSDLDVLFLAGGFGNYLNIKSAVNIGLLPEEMKDKIITLGNTSGVGALEALKSEKFDEIMADLVSNTTHIELAEDDDFALEFVMNMSFEKAL